MDQKALAAEWRAVTHGSHVVDLRAIRSRERALSYVLKYLSKGPGSEILERPQLALEWFDAVRGGRLFLRFGRELKVLPARVEDGFPNDWTWDQPLTILLEHVARGEQAAQLKLEHLWEWADEIENPYDYLLDEHPP